MTDGLDDIGRNGRKIRDSVKRYLAWRADHFRDRFGRFHEDTVAYNSAINTINQAAMQPDPEPLRIPARRATVGRLRRRA